MSNEQKLEGLEDLAQLLELVNKMPRWTQGIRNTPYDELTEAEWEIVRGSMDSIDQLAAYVRDAIMKSMRVIDNDALMSHLQAVVSAED